MFSVFPHISSWGSWFLALHPPFPPPPPPPSSPLSPFALYISHSHTPQPHASHSDTSLSHLSHTSQVVRCARRGRFGSRGFVGVLLLGFAPTRACLGRAAIGICPDVCVIQARLSSGAGNTYSSCAEGVRAVDDKMQSKSVKGGRRSLSRLSCTDASDAQVLAFASLSICCLFGAAALAPSEWSCAVLRNRCKYSAVGLR